MQRTSNPALRTLSISTSTWRRESHGLYDYENRQVTRSVIGVRAAGRVIRSGDDCFFAPEEALQPLAEGDRVLAHIEQEFDQYVVSPEEEPHWLVVSRARGNMGWKLAEGDVVKLGRVRFKVKEIYNPFVSPPTGLSQDPHQRTSLCHSKAESPPLLLTAQSPCRICLYDTYTKANPLMTPCKCSGTMRFIHLECLQQWLNSKMTMRQSGNTVSYSWKQLDCELCKQPFPLVVSLDGRVVELVEMHKPETPYLILEDERVEVGRGLHVVSLPENSSVRMGRGHESDLRISDISVSRGHALIQLTREGFFITDNHSKFGTLLLARRPIHIYDETPVSVQVSRTVLTLQLRQSYRLLRTCLSMCCCRNSAAVADFPEQREDSKDYPKEDRPAIIPLAEAISPSEPLVESESMLRHAHNRLSEGALGDTEHIEDGPESPADQRELTRPAEYSQMMEIARLETREQRARASDLTEREDNV